MTVALGVMQVPGGEDGDSNRRYLNGTLPDGGLWTALRRLSDHDHTGGLNGATLGAGVIPDGSITSSKLDPSVLAPYSLTDGSKPFTGQVTMQADAVVRDALLFGQQGTALAPDATLSRTGPGALRVDTHLGVGVNPGTWQADARAVQAGLASLWAVYNYPYAEYGVNTYQHTDGTRKALFGTNEASRVSLTGATIKLETAPAVAAGAAQTFTTRASIAPTGTLTLTPDAGQAHLTTPSGANLLLTAQGGNNILVDPAGGLFAPNRDNAIGLGYAGGRWTTVYATAGTINTSSVTLKEGITPLDPARAMAAVRNTAAVTFDYIAPTRGPEWYDLPDDPEQAQAVLAQRLTAAPLEAAARHQHGFLAEQADSLFLVGEGQTSPGSSIGVLLACLQNIDSRLAALEGAP